jgi:hypothetical protein
MMAPVSELVPRDEARAALEAQRELGPGYDDAAVERFASLIEERVREQMPVRRDQNTTAITVFSLIASIPLIAIAGSTGGLVGIALVCAALVLVNYFAYRR